MKRFFTLMGALAAVFLLFGCAQQAKTFDYGPYKQYQPKSILVLPPLNNSPDIKGSYGVMSTVTFPLAENGYYVFPVALVDQTFKENGLTAPADMHQAPIAKLHEIFGADAALYITVEKYGAQYVLTNSVITVTTKATLVDLKSGTTLWTGQATARSDEGQQQQGGLLALVIVGLIQQVVNNLSDTEQVQMASVASARLLSARPNGLLYGPRSPFFGKDAEQKK